jgi:RNA polymerase sigma-70 factor (ECF subfamily)
MVDDTTLDEWFCREVLPLEPALVRYVRRNWRDPAEVFDLVHDIYALALNGARKELPRHSQGYVFTIARHHLSQHARRGRIVSFELMADPESLAPHHDLLETERHINARDQLRRAQEGLNNLPPRCREVVYLRKVEGLTTREAAERLGVGIDAIEQQLTKGMRALTDFMLGGSGRIARSKSTSVEKQDKRDDR